MGAWIKSRRSRRLRLIMATPRLRLRIFPILYAGSLSVRTKRENLALFSMDRFRTCFPARPAPGYTNCGPWMKGLPTSREMWTRDARAAASCIRPPPLARIGGSRIPPRPSRRKKRCCPWSLAPPKSWTQAGEPSAAMAANGTDAKGQVLKVSGPVVVGKNMSGAPQGASGLCFFSRNLLPGADSCALQVPPCTSWSALGQPT